MELETFFPSHLHRPLLLNPHWSGRLASSQPVRARLPFQSAGVRTSCPARAGRPARLPPKLAALRASHPSRSQASLPSELAAPRASHPSRRREDGWLRERKEGVAGEDK
jgi:hypothetical protein